MAHLVRSGQVTSVKLREGLAKTYQNDILKISFIMAEKVTKETNFNLDTEEMFKVGLHFGHKTSKAHPKMEPYLYGARNTIHIIDLDKTKEKLEKALRFIQQLISEKKVLLTVGTSIQMRDLVKDFATKFDFPYVSERWLGGTFTNFEVIKKRINYFKDLEEKKQGGELKKYTKKEISKIEKQLAGFERKFGGIKNLKNLPDAIFVLSMAKDTLVIKEAKTKNIKVIGISDTDADPTLADYPIPANDNAKSSIKYILERVAEVIEKTKQETKSKEKETEKKSKDEA